MPIGPLELVVLVVIVLVLFGYRKLPGLGRSAGEGVKQLKDSAQEVVGDKLDPSTIGKTAGQGMREAREFKEALTGAGQSAAKPAAKKTPPPDAEEPAAQPPAAEQRSERSS